MAAIAACVLFIPGAFAVQDAGVFQLDGNAFNTANSTPAMPTATEDADNICAANLKDEPSNPADAFCHPTSASKTYLQGLSTTATRSSFVSDGNGQFASGLANDDQWTGGSKDDQAISAWKWKDAASSNDKSDIENAFAAVYTPSSGPAANHKLIYFGGTRTSNSGSENTAFWFLQGQVAEVPNGTGTSAGFCTLSSGCGFSGAHVAAVPGADNCLTPQGQTTGIQMTGKTAGSSCTESDNGTNCDVNGLNPGSGSGPCASTDAGGDVLVVSAFSIGGTQPTTTAYEWVGTGNAPKSLCVTSACSVLKISGSEPGCDPTNIPENPVCAITNQNVQYNQCPVTNPPTPCVAGNAEPIPSPWIYTEKSSDSATSGASACTVAANAMCPGVYFEGGLDLTALGLGGECTSSFTMDTRSSASVDASLQDLAMGQLGSCTSKLTTTAGANANGLTIYNGADTQTQTNGTVSSGMDSATVTVNGASSWSGTVDFYLCGPLASSTAVCDSGGVKLNGTTGNVGVTVNQGTSTVSSGSATLTSAGRYCWFAHFTSNTTGVASQDENGSTDTALTGTSDPNPECFNVSPVTPTLPTCSGSFASATDNTCTPATAVSFGSAVGDTARLTGAAREPGSNGGSYTDNVGCQTAPCSHQTTYTSINATDGTFHGNIGFTLKGPDGGGATGGTPNCTDNATAFTGETQTFPINDAVTGNSDYTVSFKPGSPGTYHWVAKYSYVDSQGNNLAVNNVLPQTFNGDCSQSPNEDVTVRQIPTQISTTQKVIPQDHAVITSSVTGDNIPAGGTVTFYLYAGDTAANNLTNCQAHGTTVNSGGLVYKQAFSTSSTPATSESFDSANTVAVSANTTVYWRVTYATGDTAHTGRQSDCQESTATSFTNDSGPGTLFTP